MAHVIGNYVRLTTTTGLAAEGHVYAYDSARGLLTLEEKPEHTVLKSNFRVVNEKCIAGEVKVVEDRCNALAEDAPALPAQSIDRVLAREVAAIQKAEEDLARIGVGVTDEVQNIFNYFCEQYVHCSVGWVGWVGWCGLGKG
jgi:hypothetical protein